MSRIGSSMLGRNEHVYVRISIERLSPGIRIELIRPVGNTIAPYPDIQSPIEDTDYVDLLDVMAAAGCENDGMGLTQYPKSSNEAILLLEKFARPSIEGSYSPFTDAAVVQRINKRIEASRASRNVKH